MGCISYALIHTYKEWAFLTTCSSLQLIVSNVAMCGECLSHKCLHRLRGIQSQIHTIRTYAHPHAHMHARTHTRTHAHTHTHTLPITHKGGAVGEFDAMFLKDFHIFWNPPLLACTSSPRDFCTEQRVGMRVWRVNSITNFLSPSWSSMLKNCPNPMALGGASAPGEGRSRADTWSTPTRWQPESPVQTQPHTPVA